MTLKVFYFKSNFGDLLTPYLLESFFPNFTTEHIMPAAIAQADFFGVGSIMEWALSAKQPLTIWGSGLMLPDSQFHRQPNHQILAVRGRLTADRLGWTGVIGDPGLLVSRLLAPTAKRYKYGFVPHYVDQKTAIAQQISSLPNVKTIDVLNRHNLPDKLFCEQVLAECAACEAILSSSLHGLIIADALNIPNAHLLLSDGVYGDSYKFRDYYSAFGRNHQAVDLRLAPNAPSPAISGAVLDNFLSLYRPITGISHTQDELLKTFADFAANHI
ncbi:MAG: polysaccharide pyruvyl transferase family protein [Candidatus Nomurabacteria bacterium]|jgi:hypothetical protein|nr:polysaccharide pyruvyl transferase family protein [Candidatus Nomurabacteria bacterium]